MDASMFSNNNISIYVPYRDTVRHWHKMSKLHNERTKEMIQRFLSNKWNLMGLISLCVVLLCMLFNDSTFTIQERVLTSVIIFAMCFLCYLFGLYRGILHELMKWSKYADLIHKESKKVVIDKDSK